MLGDSEYNLYVFVILGLIAYLLWRCYGVLLVINWTLNLISNNKGYVNKMEMLRIRETCKDRTVLMQF